MGCGKWVEGLLVSWLALLMSAPALAQRVDVGRFSLGKLDGWQEKSFAGETRYVLREEEGGGRALHAVSNASASGLFREIQVDLQRTPFLHWSWKVENLLPAGDERSKAGDDYPARIYVVFPGGLFFWRTRAINYVWSSDQPVGSEWPNAYTANARMIAVRSGSAGLGQWQQERRDVRADYRRLFGEEPGDVAAVAIMTDTDNTGATAEAWYGDIWFDSR
jgi:hypothetical protein